MRDVALVQCALTILPLMKISVPGVQTFIVVRPNAGHGARLYRTGAAPRRRVINSSHTRTS